MTLLHRLLALVLLASNLAAHSQPSSAPAPSLERVEPPTWWVGMQRTALQLMVHGQRIADLRPELSHPGVTLREVTRVENGNYLFLNLDIAPDTPVGAFEIRFRGGQGVVLRHHYTLHAREARSAQRQGFGPKDVIYLLVPDRFANGAASNDTVATLSEATNRSDPGGRHGGDLQGIAQHLDYIAGMGFTQIWPTPLTENNQPKHSYHGYASTDLYQIDARFGSNEDYRALVAAARSKGIGFIADIVLNHIGSSHWWMRDLPARDWLNQWERFTETNHKRSTLLDPNAAPSDRKGFTDGWFVNTMPDLNQRNPLLAEYLIQNSIWWVEYAGLSGIREDTFSYSDKGFLANWAGRLLQEYSQLTMVGEEWTSSPALIAYWQRGKRNDDGFVPNMPSMMDFPFYEALHHALLAPEDHASGLGKLYEVVAHDFLYPDPARLVIFEGNHDTSRLFSALNEDLALTRMAMVYLATMRGIPQFFYGTEVLMTSPKQRDDGLVRADFPGGWPGDRVNAVTGQGLTGAQRETQQFLRQLLNWRKGAPAVHHGKLMHYTPQQGTYVYFRYNDSGKVMVVLNKNATDTTLDTRRFVEMLGPKSWGRDVIKQTRYELGQSLLVPARTALVLEIGQ
ncbi:glycoside hydrolase family 13 protein [Rhodoferax sp.]|uniref:glycoside hydrolase family 13 protein n=1 Tax=Rhodoferax sp. TaxID=50421 RepID=UPI002747C817|nr:glycoside hydrolase family 13 protein [Rhodoferax sp.]